MKRVSYDGAEGMVAWAAARLEGRFPSDATAIGLRRDGELIAAAVFYAFEKRSCRISIATTGRQWLTPDFARHVAAHPFLTCGFTRVTAIIRESRPRAVQLVEHLGFKLEGRLREAGPDGEDDLVFGMLRRECRWLPKSLIPPSRQIVDAAL